MSESRAMRVKVRTPMRSPARGNMAHLDAKTTGGRNRAGAVAKATWRDILGTANGDVASGKKVGMIY